MKGLPIIKAVLCWRAGGFLRREYSILRCPKVVKRDGAIAMGGYTVGIEVIGLGGSIYTELYGPWEGISWPGPKVCQDETHKILVSQGSDVGDVVRVVLIF